MAFRGLAIDLDGTLLVGEDIPPDNVAAVRAARDAGYAIIIATARWRQLAQRVEEIIGIRGPIIACSGAQVYVPGVGDVFDERLPEDLCEPLYALCDSGRCIATLTYSDHTVIKLDGEPDRSAMTPEMSWVPALGPVNAGIPRVAVVQGREMIALIRETLQPRFADRVQFVGSVGPTGRPNLTIVAKQAGKGAALTAACKHLGLATESVVAFGDAENDLEMFAVAGGSVAMGQADEMVKAAADVVTLPNHEAGVARAIERLLSTGELR